MEIQCPTSGMFVLVSGSGSGSGSGPVGTICVRGTVSDRDLGDAEGLSPLVRVRVLAGHVPPPPLPPPEPKEPGDVDVTPAGYTWCAHDVPVSGSSASGVPLTVVAWLCTGGSKWLPPHSEAFYAGGPAPVDCCTGCEPAQGERAAFAAWPPPPPPLPPL